uniref:(California timema) hypothetical protein n=1 Tax=Timema californicum TaxID=61474 RepID=A0A7R9PG31_TIMCA|nr:unnamed protein product [Timema californicum]
MHSHQPLIPPLCPVVCPQEPVDEVTEMLDRKKKEGLAYKRSFFVRMVSDPKIYNPKIAKSLASSHRRSMERETGAPVANGVTIQTPIASWISWPLAFLFQGVLDDVASSEVPVR